MDILYSTDYSTVLRITDSINIFTRKLNVRHTNPVGKLNTRYLGKPRLIFDPCDYGDPYTKKTCLWGNFNIPKKNPVKPTEGSKMHLLPPSKYRAALRSVTPLGFAKAFFEANR